jgi:TRAP-type transport system periplasmic protein
MVSLSTSCPRSGIFQRRLCSLVVGAALALAVVAGPSEAVAQSVVVKIGTSPVPGHVTNQIYERWGEQVAERSNGEIALELFPAGQLGGQQEMVEGLLLGSLQGTEATIAVTNSWVKEAGVFDLPFLFRNPDHALAVYDGPIGQAIAEKYLEHGFRVVGFSLAGIRNPFGVAPLNTPDDIRGRKIRVIQSPLHIDLWRQVGANPTPIPDPEIYTSLQTGVVEFADNTVSNYYSRKWFEVAPFLTTLGHIYAINAFIVSEDWWQQQTPEHRQVMQEAFAELVPTKHELILAGDKTALEGAVNAGATHVEVSDLGPWQEAMNPIWEAWAADVEGGKDLIEAILAAN